MIGLSQHIPRFAVTRHVAERHQSEHTITAVRSTTNPVTRERLVFVLSNLVQWNEKRGVVVVVGVVVGSSTCYFNRGETNLSD